MNTKAYHRRVSPEAGFTLIELMIVVLIIGILASVAIYNYSDYLRRTKLTEAQNALSAYRVAEEQYFQDNRTYLAAGAGGGCGAVLPIPPAMKYFTMSCTATATTFLAKATGMPGTQVSAFEFSIDQINTRVTTKVLTGWGTANQQCWVIRKGGTCS